LTCVNSTLGVALRWTPLRTVAGPVSYVVYRCDRYAEPGGPGCERLFTAESPVLVGPVSLGADYVVQAQPPASLAVSSNRLVLP